MRIQNVYWLFWAHVAVLFYDECIGCCIFAFYGLRTLFVARGAILVTVEFFRYSRLVGFAGLRGYGTDSGLTVCASAALLNLR